MRNFKIKVTPEQSEVVQKLLFLAGYSWLSGDKNIKFTDKKYLFFDCDHITTSSLDTYYIQDNNPEITFEEFITEIEIELNEKI